MFSNSADPTQIHSSIIRFFNPRVALCALCICEALNSILSCIAKFAKISMDDVDILTGMVSNSIMSDQDKKTIMTALHDKVNDQ